MVTRTEQQDVTIEVSGKRIPKFKAGSELANKVNAVYIDTNEASEDGGEYDYSVTFHINNTMTEPSDKEV